MSVVLDPSFYFLNGYAIPVALVSTLIFATGLFVFLQNRGSPTNLTFFLLCLAINLWLYGISIMQSARDSAVALFWYRTAVFLGVCYISPLVYTFSVLWLGLYPKQKFFVWSSFLTGLIFYVAAHLTSWILAGTRTYYWGLYPAYGWGGRIFLFFFFGFFLAAFYNFFSRLRTETSPLKRKQIGLIAVAFLISLTGSVDYLPKVAQVSIYPFGYLSVFIWILVVAYLIVRYRVMDIQTVIHKTILWFGSSSVFALPVILFSYVGKDWLAALEPVYFSALVFGLIILFMLYVRFVQPVIDHLFQRRRWDLAKSFEHFTDELVHLKELASLSTHIVETIRSVFYVKEISLLLSKDEASALECVSSVPPGQSVRFERNRPFIDWLEQNDALVIREYLDLDPKYQEIKEAARDYFEIVNVPLCVPLLVGQRLLGIINIGQKANLKPFDTAEIGFLSDLRRAAAIALSNSLRSIAMQESLRQWNVELEKKVDERTRELKETQAQLIQAEKLASIGTLAGGIAHEINNPLTAVLTNVQMLKMLGEAPDPESLSLIEEGAKRCQVIIQKLMRYARKTDEVENYQEVDVNKVIRNVCDFLAYQVNQENVEIALSLRNVEPIRGIANELEQVFTNLILNSRDAIKEAGRKGKINIRTFPENGRVRIEVSDNGAGIKRERLARVFDPFYTTKDVGEGTGLGLTVTSGIVEKHLGKISVSSVEGESATFTILFPTLKTKTSTVTA